MIKAIIAIIAAVGGACLFMAVGACLLGAYWSISGVDASPAIRAAFLCAIPGAFAVGAATLIAIELWGNEK